MTLRYADRIKQITTTPPGSSPFALATTPAGFFAFSSIPSIAVNDTTYYEADDGGANVEIGLGTYSAANTLTRTTIYKSSNSGSPVTFANNVTVICTAPASKLALLTAAGILPALDASLLTNIQFAGIVGLGAAAAQAVTDPGFKLIGLNGAAVASHLLSFSNTNGTAQDSGFSPSSFAPATIVSSSGPSGSAPQGTLWAVV